MFGCRTLCDSRSSWSFKVAQNSRLMTSHKTGQPRLCWPALHKQGTKQTHRWVQMRTTHHTSTVSTRTENFTHRHRLRGPCGVGACQYFCCSLMQHAVVQYHTSWAAGPAIASLLLGIPALIWFMHECSKQIHPHTCFTYMSHANTRGPHIVDGHYQTRCVADAK